MEKLVKNVEPKSWHLIRVEASKHGMTIGQLLKLLINEHLKMEKKKTGWDEILREERTITDLEAEKIKSAMRKFEKSYGFED